APQANDGLRCSRQLNTDSVGNGSRFGRDEAHRCANCWRDDHFNRSCPDSSASIFCLDEGARASSWNAGVIAGAAVRQIMALAQQQIPRPAGLGMTACGGSERWGTRKNSLPDRGSEIFLVQRAPPERFFVIPQMRDSSE